MQGRDKAYAHKNVVVEFLFFVVHDKKKKKEITFLYLCDISMYEYKFQSRKSSLIHLEQILENPILNENLLIEFCAKSTKISRIHQIYIYILHLRVNSFNQRHGECVGRESSYSTKRTCQLKRRARNDRSKWIPDLAISFDDLAFPRRQFVGARFDSIPRIGFEGTVLHYFSFPPISLR